jgi:hypothetical protein
MCVACHPERPSIIAAGSFNGEVRAWPGNAPPPKPPLTASAGGESGFKRAMVTRLVWCGCHQVLVWDVSGGGGKDEESLLASSAIDDYFHREPVIKVREPVNPKTRTVTRCG